jgi:2'-hydroxyisoflavone reductase
MNRREAIRTGAAAIAGALLAPRVPAQTSTRAMRVLILGGTGFIGPHFVEALQAGGHTVTLFNRGRRNAGSVSGVEILIGDRNGQLDALKNRDWDVAIDNSGYVPRDVRASAELLAGRVQHYIFISSISAYADFKSVNIDEDYALARLKDPSTTEVTGESYGGLKVLCEEAVQKTYGSRCAIVRPTYIVGPGDTSDRFTYWPVRVKRGGDMLAPGAPGDPIQFIDVRDLAAFVRRVTEERIAGTFNTCNPPRAVSIGALLETCKRETRSDARFHWASAEFLAQHKLVDSNEIPIWAPAKGDLMGMALVSPARAVAKGLSFRSVETTVRDTLAWHARRPAEQQKLRAGLSPERESELLKLLASGESHA